MTQAAHGRGRRYFLSANFVGLGNAPSVSSALPYRPASIIHDWLAVGTIRNAIFYARTGIDMSKKPKVLVVDNEMDSLAKIYINLLLKDFRVEATNVADEIIPRIKRFKPNAVIINNELPGFDAFQVCAAVKEHNLPVILLIEKTSPATAQLDSCRADEVVYKPVDVNDLAQIILRLVTTHQ